MKRLYIIIAALLISSTVISAQNFRTGYFLDGYMYKYQLNPAFQGERGFVAMPVLGGLSLGLESNLALGTFSCDGSAENIEFASTVTPSGSLSEIPLISSPCCSFKAVPR